MHGWTDIDIYKHFAITDGVEEGRLRHEVEN